MALLTLGGFPIEGSNIWFLWSTQYLPILIIGDGPDLSRIKHHYAIHSPRTSLYGVSSLNLFVSIFLAPSYVLLSLLSVEGSYICCWIYVMCYTGYVQCWWSWTSYRYPCGGIKVNYQLHLNYSSCSKFIVQSDHAADMGLQGKLCLNNLSNLGVANSYFSLSL